MTMNKADETLLTGRIPSVQTRWYGTGTLSASFQGLVIALVIGSILSVIYAGVRTQISYWEWHGLFTWVGLIPTVLVMIRFWRNPKAETPGWWSRPDREWLYGPTIWLSNFWPLVIYLWWTKVVNTLAGKFDAEPQVAIGAAFLIGGMVGGGLLVFRLATELVEPLKGNAIEPMIKQMEIRFEKWKLERDKSVDVIKDERDQLRAQVTELRQQLKDNQMRVRIMYANRGNDINPALINQGPDDDDDD